MQRALFDKYDVCRMKQALCLARSVKGKTHDNPAVGAVIYKKGKILGKGKTHAPGRDHAEKDALKHAGGKARGATMAVTLEPCCHFGRTGPCTKSIIEAGIRRVVVAVKDPNPKMNGKGIRELQKAGIRVDTGLFEKEAAQMNQDFFKFIRHGIPYVALKAALTLDGRIAADNGDSKWITSPPSRKRAHALRSVYDAVLVGMNTVRYDNPLLNVRLVKGKSPIRVVLSSGSDLSPASLLAKTASSIRTILLTPKKIRRPACKAIEYHTIPCRGNRMDIKAVLRVLGGLGIKSLFIEGGSGIFTAFIEQKCVDIFYLFLSPKILGSGIPFMRGKKTRAIAGAFELKDVKLEKTGSDILITAQPAK